MTKQDERLGEPERGEPERQDFHEKRARASLLLYPGGHNNAATETRREGKDWIRWRTQARRERALARSELRANSRIGVRDGDGDPTRHKQIRSGITLGREKKGHHHIMSDSRVKA